MADAETLKLEDRDKLQNHMQTIHAAAQFTLAETQSGLFLQRLFPALEGMVVPLLREGSMKYRKPVTDTVYAMADVSDEMLENFETMFNKKGRGSIGVTVLLKDDAGEVYAKGVFVWFIQRRDQE